MNLRLTLLAIVCTLGCAESSTAQRSGDPSEVDGVTVYFRSSFEDGRGKWGGANGGKLSILDEGGLGKSLQVLCTPPGFRRAPSPLQRPG